MRVRFFYDNVKYRLRFSKAIRRIIQEIIIFERKVPGDLFFIITNDSEIRKINREFLKHDYFTDVISFGYNSGKLVNGEIYISIDTVKRNAINYKVSLSCELARVIIHGTLHICGYDDKTEKEKQLMTMLEDKWLNKVIAGSNGF